MGDADLRPSMRGRDRFSGRKAWLRRAARLAALAVVCTVLFLPQAAPAGGVLAASDPSITPVIGGTVGTNGWYRSAVTLVWQIQPAPDPGTIIGCQPVTIAVDTTGASYSCSATWGDVTKSETRRFKVDRTPPGVAASPARSPDAGGWYNHPVTVSFGGKDATSGVASCSAATYAGPDNAAAHVSGTCTDVAGNAGSGTFALAYDSTPPKLLKLSSKPTKRGVVLKWAASADTQRVQVTRSPGKGAKSAQVVYAGAGKTFPDKGLRVGKRYRYTVSAFDAAANRASRTVTVTATGALLAPAPGQRVTGRPRLTWTPTRGASYYNVQLVRGGTILSVWPRTTSLSLPRSWIFHGHRYRLHRGTYRWYVWPGFGTLAAARYGGLLGRSSFLFAG
jgi:hypothetical protein